MKAFLYLFICKHYYKKNIIQTRSGAQRAGLTVGKRHGHDKSLLPNLKPQKAAKILSLLPSSTSSINQPQIITNVPIRRGVGRAGLKRKVQCTNPLLKPKVFSKSPKIQRPTLPSQNLQIPSTQRMIHPHLWKENK